MIINYCSIYGDSDERNLYFDMGDKIKIDYCEVCKMVLNRDEAILQAAKIVKIRKKKFFFGTLDGVSIASQRFYDIYHTYNMQGIEFIPFEKSHGYYVCKFLYTMHFDIVRSKSVRIEYQGKVSYGILDNGNCSVCKRSFGHHHPWPYRMTVEDEKKLNSNTFYRSDIEFGEMNFQHPLLWATDGIIQAFTKEKCRIFYKNVEGNFGKGDCGKAVL
ncbi:hypothetical protein KP612_01085 [Treponema denticola]|uniref:Uncharacterized protein n=2 Tax=Treponema denticola TaxID=158 RepID=A0A0E2E2K8_TREDN|nr:hypothetical protein [Treponema denticola]EMB22996.1 hypothetical protein HMPREF9724_01265 [Treponema denticola SP37]EPF34986.1 hypothetical protein HMPREF9734_00532 [Treponema denticola SP44]EPF38871.1 hypothetical protein HMPREF9731_02123 [Treponema denticola SP23]EMB31585.1 hypothetical protein HMPREF9726_01965 [Treponema denticola H-22]UTC89628.1 hypothetical protein E4N87_02525 [Treponema denticola]